jgi:hypothetical protein
MTPRLHAELSKLAKFFGCLRIDPEESCSRSSSESPVDSSAEVSECGTTWQLDEAEQTRQDDLVALIKVSRHP